MSKYRTEVYWLNGILNVKIWKHDVFLNLTTDTESHPRIARFLKLFQCCKAGKWNIYEINASDVAFLLMNMKVTYSDDYRNQVFNH